MTTNPWAWQDGRNPYRTTAFQILALGPQVRGRAAIRAHVRTRRQRIASAPERFRAYGRLLDEAGINEAAQRLAKPQTRLLDELRTHRPAAPSARARPEPVDRLDGLAVVAVVAAGLASIPTATGCADLGAGAEAINLPGLLRLLPAPHRTFPPLYGGGS